MERYANIKYNFSNHAFMVGVDYIKKNKSSPFQDIKHFYAFYLNKKESNNILKFSVKNK